MSHFWTRFFLKSGIGRNYYLNTFQISIFKYDDVKVIPVTTKLISPVNIFFAGQFLTYYYEPAAQTRGL